MLKELEEKYQEKMEEYKKLKVYIEQLEKELIFAEGQLSVLRNIKEEEPTEEKEE
jgi:hypothetical protein